MKALGKLRSALDFVYLAGGVLAAICLIAILVLIVLQLLARWTGEVFPGAPEYAGYFMAAASFLAFAHALQRGSHIRVSILLNALGPGPRRVLETWCLGVACAIAWYFLYWAWDFVRLSWKLGDISQGQDMTPLWIPQSFLLAGSAILATTLTDNLIRLLFAGRHGIRRNAVDQGFRE